MLWDLFQMGHIERSRSASLEAQCTAREAQGDVRQLQSKLRVLEQQCERLNLAAMAMADHAKKWRPGSARAIETDANGVPPDP